MTAPSSQPSESREQSELTRQLRDEIESQGPLISTISDLLARLDEPDPTIEARVRVGRVLAEGGLQTNPALTAMFVKPGSTIRVMLAPVGEAPPPPPRTDRQDVSPVANAVQAWRNSGGHAEADTYTQPVAFFWVLFRETWQRIRRHRRSKT